MGITGNISTTTAGLDRFGRVTDQRWVKADGNTIDRYTYTYDRGSNRTTRNNKKKSKYNEDYTYDGLQRLVDVDRNDDPFQSWTLSQTGNWNSFVNQATTTAKTFNNANEITAIDSSASQIGFDPAGNMTKMPSAQDSSATRHATYDAWNRMTACKADNSGSPGTTIATYSYDGLRRRVRKVVTADSVTHDNYYSASWQLLEVRKNSDTDPLDQYVWCLRYIDAVAIRFHDGNLDGDYNDGDDSTYYYTNDANMNVTALIDPGATCRGRFAYDAYGQPLFLKKHWDVRTIQESYRDNPILYAGYHYDQETGLYNVRHRTYDPTLARWMQKDPLGYVDGMNVYEYGMSRPATAVDPSGQCTRQWRSYSVQKVKFDCKKHTCKDSDQYDPYHGKSTAKLHEDLAETESAKDAAHRAKNGSKEGKLWDKVQSLKAEIQRRTKGCRAIAKKCKKWGMPPDSGGRSISALGTKDKNAEWGEPLTPKGGMKRPLGATIADSIQTAVIGIRTDTTFKELVGAPTKPNEQSTEETKGSTNAPSVPSPVVPKGGARKKMAAARHAQTKAMGNTSAAAGGIVLVGRAAEEALLVRPKITVTPWKKGDDCGCLMQEWIEKDKDGNPAHWKKMGPIKSKQRIRHWCGI